MERKLLIRVDGRGTNEDAGIILLYRIGDRVSLVATVEKDGDAEIMLDKASAAALAEALRRFAE